MPEPPNNQSSMPLSSPGPMKADMPPAIRKRLIVSGNVQEAAYRVLVKSIARSMGITGFVRNLLDETVEIVCEAEPKTLAKFIKSIDRKGDPASPLDLNVVSMTETPAPVEGEFNIFKIEYDGMLTPEEHERARVAREERMILEAATLKDEIKTVGKDVRGVGTAVHDMHSDMNKRFDHMAEHYDLISISLKEAIVHMDRNAEKTDKAIEKSRKETILAVRQSQKDTARILSKNHKETTAELSAARKDFAASNRELAGAVKFMIRKLSDKPPRKRPPVKRKR